MVVKKSDIDQLILGYISEERYGHTRNELFKESPHLPEKVPILDIFGEISSEHRLQTILEEFVLLKTSKSSCPICEESNSVFELWQALDVLVSKIKLLTNIEQAPTRPKAGTELRPVSPSEVTSVKAKPRRCFGKSPDFESSTLKLVPLTTYGSIGAFHKKNLYPHRTSTVNSNSETSKAEVDTDLDEIQQEKTQSLLHETSRRRKKTITPRHLSVNARHAKETENLELYAHDGDLSRLLNFGDNNEALVKVGANIITNMMKCAEKRQKTDGEATPKKLAEENIESARKSPFKNPTTAGVDVNIMNTKEIQGDLVAMTIDSLLGGSNTDPMLPLSTNDDCEGDLVELRKLLGLEESSLDPLPFSSDVFLVDDNAEAKRIEPENPCLDQAPNEQCQDIHFQRNLNDVPDPVYPDQECTVHIHPHTVPITNEDIRVNTVAANNVELSVSENLQAKDITLSDTNSTSNIMEIESNAVSASDNISDVRFNLHDQCTMNETVSCPQTNDTENIQSCTRMDEEENLSTEELSSSGVNLKSNTTRQHVGPILDTEVLICTSEVPEMDSVLTSCRSMPPKKRFLVQEHFSSSEQADEGKKSGRKSRSKSAERPNEKTNLVKLCKRGKLSLSPKPATEICSNVAMHKITNFLNVNKMPTSPTETSPVTAVTSEDFIDVDHLSQNKNVEQQSINTDPEIVVEKHLSPPGPDLDKVEIEDEIQVHVPENGESSDTVKRNESINGSIQVVSDVIVESSDKHSTQKLRRSSRTRKPTKYSKDNLTKRKSSVKIQKSSSAKEASTRDCSNKPSDVSKSDRATTITSKSNQFRVPALINARSQLLDTPEQCTSTATSTMQTLVKNSSSKVHVMKPGKGSVVINLMKAGRMPIHVKGIVVQPKKGIPINKDDIIGQLVQQIQPRSDIQMTEAIPVSHSESSVLTSLIDNVSRTTPLFNAQTVVVSSEASLRSEDFRAPLPVYTTSEPELNILSEATLELEEPEEPTLQDVPSNPSLMPYNLIHPTTQTALSTPPKYKYNNKFSTISPSSGIFSIIERSMNKSAEPLNPSATLNRLDAAKSNLFSSFLANSTNICATNITVESDCRNINKDNKPQEQNVEYATLSKVFANQESNSLVSTDICHSTKQTKPAFASGHNEPLTATTNSPPNDEFVKELDTDKVSMKTKKAAFKSSKIMYNRHISRFNRPTNIRPKPKKGISGLYLCNKVKNMIRIEPKRFGVPSVRRYYMQSNADEANISDISHMAAVQSEVIPQVQTTVLEPCTSNVERKPDATKNQVPMTEPPTKKVRSKRKKKKRRLPRKSREISSKLQEDKQDSNDKPSALSSTGHSQIQEIICDKLSEIDNEKVKCSVMNDNTKKTYVVKQHIEPINNHEQSIGNTRTVLEVENQGNEMSPSETIAVETSDLFETPKEPEEIPVTRTSSNIIESAKDSDDISSVSNMKSDETTLKQNDDEMNMKDNNSKIPVGKGHEKDDRAAKKLKRKARHSDSHAKRKKKKLPDNVLKSPVLSWSYEEIQAKLRLLYDKNEKQSKLENSVKNEPSGPDSKTSNVLSNGVPYGKTSESQRNGSMTKEVQMSPYYESDPQLVICEDFSSPNRTDENASLVNLQPQKESTFESEKIYSLKTNILPKEQNKCKDKKSLNLKSNAENECMMEKSSNDLATTAENTTPSSPHTKSPSYRLKKKPTDCGQKIDRCHQKADVGNYDIDKTATTNSQGIQLSTDELSSTREQVANTLKSPVQDEYITPNKAKIACPKTSPCSAEVQKTMAKTGKKPRRISLIRVLPEDEINNSGVSDFPCDPDTLAPPATKVYRDSPNTVQLVAHSLVELSTREISVSTSGPEVTTLREESSSKEKYLSEVTEEVVFDFQMEPLDLSCSSWGNEMAVDMNVTKKSNNVESHSGQPESSKFPKEPVKTSNDNGQQVFSHHKRSSPPKRTNDSQRHEKGDSLRNKKYHSERRRSRTEYKTDHKREKEARSRFDIQNRSHDRVKDIHKRRASDHGPRSSGRANEGRIYDRFSHNPHPDCESKVYRTHERRSRSRSSCERKSKSRNSKERPHSISISNTVPRSPPTKKKNKVDENYLSSATKDKYHERRKDKSTRENNKSSHRVRPVSQKKILSHDHSMDRNRDIVIASPNRQYKLIDQRNPLHNSEKKVLHHQNFMNDSGNQVKLHPDKDGSLIQSESDFSHTNTTPHEKIKLSKDRKSIRRSKKKLQKKIRQVDLEKLDISKFLSSLNYNDAPG